MDSKRTPPGASPPEEGGHDRGRAEELRALALRRARLSAHMRRHDRPLSK